MPRTAVALAQAELEQQFQMVVVVRRGTTRAAVVHRLAVVRVRTRFQQHPREFQPVLVWRLVTFTSPEGTGQRRER
jgi:hypothetical protein